MKKDVKKSQGQTAAKAKSGTRSGSSKKSDTNNSTYSATAIGCFENEKGEKITIWTNEKCEPIRFVETEKKEVIAVIGRERIDECQYKTLDEAIGAYINTNWKAIGSIAVIVAEQIIKKTQNK